MINLELEKAFKEIYLPLFTYNVKTNDDILSNINNTYRDVYGKEIIRVDESEMRFGNRVQIKKELQTLMTKIKISNKAIRACKDSYTAIANLCNDVWTNAVQETIRNLFHLLCEEIRKDCEIDCDDNQIRKALRQLNSYEFYQILLHELTEWQFIANEDGELGRPSNEGNFTIYTLVKYCNFTISKEVRDRIKELV